MHFDSVGGLRLAGATGGEAAANRVVHDLLERFTHAMHFPLQQVEDIGVERERGAHKGIMMLNYLVVKMPSEGGSELAIRPYG